MSLTFVKCFDMFRWMVLWKCKNPTTPWQKNEVRYLISSTKLTAGCLLKWLPWSRGKIKTWMITTKFPMLQCTEAIRAIQCKNNSTQTGRNKNVELGFNTWNGSECREVQWIDMGNKRTGNLKRITNILFSSKVGLLVSYSHGEQLSELKRECTSPFAYFSTTNC